jgi:hypothetical protein
MGSRSATRNEKVDRSSQQHMYTPRACAGIFATNNSLLQASGSRQGPFIRPCAAAADQTQRRPTESLTNHMDNIATAVLSTQQGLFSRVESLAVLCSRHSSP